MTSVANQLKNSIDTWAEVLRTSPLRDLVERGQITPQALCLYLESLRYMFRQSEANVRVAAARCEDLELKPLLSYFRSKAREEDGHDQWAVNDLSRLPEEITSGIQPARAIVKLVELQTALIAEHPLCFVALIVWSEYTTALLGEEWLNALEVSGYSREQLSAVAKHIDADKGHASRGFRDLDELWTGDVALNVILDAVRRAQGLFESFCLEIYDVAQRAA